ncbi:hypothetical protein [Staphylococcus aureus]
MPTTFGGEPILIHYI